MVEVLEQNPDIKKEQEPSNEKIAEVLNSGEKILTIINGVVEVADSREEMGEKHRDNIEK